jgi:hypothetical protein
MSILSNKLRARVRSKQECEFIVVNPRTKHNPSDLSVRIAKRITSKFNQHLTIIMVGGTGTGKSWAAMDLAYKTAKEVARIKLGRNATSASWQKYFNLDHMAIITLDRVTTLLQHITPNGIYILDDIGVGYSNRDFMQDKNKKMNQIIQTFRTDNTCVIYTVPSKGLIDKVPRELVEWYFEFDRSEQTFTEGLNACKFLDITTLKREGRQLFMYDLIIGASGADQFVRHIAEKPPDLLTVPYEKLRLEIALELRKENAELIEASMGEAAAKERGGGTGLSPSQLRTVEMYVDVNARRNGGMKSGEACDAAGLKASTYKELRKGRTDWFTEYMKLTGQPLAPD